MTQSTVRMSVRRSAICKSLSLTSIWSVGFGEDVELDCLRVAPTGMVGSRRKAAERSTTLRGDLSWVGMGDDGSSADRRMLRRSMILRREISWGVRRRVSRKGWTDVGGVEDWVDGGVVPEMGELESLGMRKRGRPGGAEVGSALRRGMVSGDPTEGAVLFWRKWKLVRSESFANVFSVFGANVGSLGVNPFALCLIKSDREVGFGSYLGEAIGDGAGSEVKEKKETSKLLAYKQSQ